MSEWLRAEVWKDGPRTWAVALVSTPLTHPQLRIIDRPGDCENGNDFDNHADALAWAIHKTHRPPLGAAEATNQHTQEDK